MAHEIPTAVEIDRKLREDFRNRLKEFGVPAEATDPVLAVLFRTFAVQLEQLYAETDRIRLALLDELIEGLGIERRRARAAQTVVRFLPAGVESALVEAGTALLGESSSGERINFTTDGSIMSSQARIACALCYQEGELRVLSGVELPEEMAALRPSLDPARASLGPYPAIWLAVENLPPSHLSRHGFFFDLGPDSEVLLRAFKQEPWRLAGPEGELTAAGVMRPAKSNGGLLQLRWLKRPHEEGGGEEQPAVDTSGETPDLPAGYYAGRVFTMPEIPSERRFRAKLPLRMEAPLQRIFGPASGQAFSQPRAWIQISLPREAPPLHLAVLNVSLHAVTASNAELLNETVRFDQHGRSIPLSREAGGEKFLVAPLSVIGERAAYLPQFDPSDEPGRGRFSVHHGRIQLEPARRPDGSIEDYANIRVWLTSGAAANDVGPGRIQSFLKRGSAPAVRIVNPTSAAGGADSEGFEEAKQRFAAALLTRSRIVTAQDLEAAAKAFDPRILAVETAQTVARDENGGLQRVLRAACKVDRDAFADPDEELAILSDELRRRLEPQAVFGTRLAVEFVTE